MYIRMPDAMVDNDPSLKGKFVEVRNALYGAAQSPRAFNKHLHARLQSYGWKQSLADPCMYVRHDADGSRSFVCIYVDDVLMIGDPDHVKQFVQKLDIATNPSSGFKIRNYGIPSSFLGMEIKRTGHKVKISQTEYIKKMAASCGITGPDFPITPLPPGIKVDKYVKDSPPADSTEFRSIIGQLLYAVHVCRPDAAQPVHALSRHLHEPTEAGIKLAHKVGVVLTQKDPTERCD